MLKSIAIFLLLTLPICANAVDDTLELAKKSQNPVEKMVSIPFNTNFNMGYGSRDNTQIILDLKPVIPFSLNESWNLITRTIIPITHQPNLLPNNGSAYINGIGDILPTVFLSPAHPGPIIWGAGPAVSFPTASNKQLGFGKYCAGPSLVFLAMPQQWVVGVLAFNVWSFAGETNRPSVNTFELQYFINYNFPHGWYLTSQPIITSDWTATSNNRWTIPVGIGGGRVFSLGKQPLSVSLQAYDNIKTPGTLGPNWQFQFNVTLLYPE